MKKSPQINKIVEAKVDPVEDQAICQITALVDIIGRNGSEDTQDKSISLGSGNDDSSLPVGKRKIASSGYYEDDIFADTFPVKLFNLLKSETKDIVEWLDHGDLFRINDIDRFANDIVPKYFKQTKLSSFQRQLNLYGFKRILKGADKGAYFHPQFHRDRQNEISAVKRVYQKKEDDHEQQQTTSVMNAGGFTIPFNPLVGAADQMHAFNLLNNVTAGLYNSEFEAMIRQNNARTPHPYQQLSHHKQQQQQQPLQSHLLMSSLIGMNSSSLPSIQFPMPLSNPPFPQQYLSNPNHASNLSYTDVGLNSNGASNLLDQHNSHLLNQLYYNQWVQQLQMQTDQQVAIENELYHKRVKLSKSRISGSSNIKTCTDQLEKDLNQHWYMDDMLKSNNDSSSEHGLNTSSVSCFVSKGPIPNKKNNANGLN